MKKWKLFLFVILISFISVKSSMVYASILDDNEQCKNTQCIICKYDVLNYEVQFDVISNNSGKVSVQRSEKRLENDNTHSIFYNFIDSETNVISSANFIKNESLACPSTLYYYVPVSAGGRGGTSYNVQLSFAEFSTSKANSALKDEEKNNKPFIKTDNKKTDEEISQDNNDLDINKDICSNGILKTFKLAGNILFIVKILIPVILILLGSVDFGKAVINSDQDAIKKSAKSFLRRIALGVFVFLLPTLVSFFFNLISDNNVAMGDFKACSNCLFYPNDSSKCNAS